MKHVMMLATLGTLLVTGCATGTGPQRYAISATGQVGLGSLAIRR